MVTIAAGTFGVDKAELLGDFFDHFREKGFRGYSGGCWGVVDCVVILRLGDFGILRLGDYGILKLGDFEILRF